MAPSQVIKYYVLAFLLLFAAVLYQIYAHFLADAAHDGLSYLLSTKGRFPRAQLLVGVASHLGDVDLRNAVRKTWKRLARPGEAEVLFFTPERLCAIDEYWRLRKNSCQPWNVFVPVNINENVPVRPYRVQPSMVRPSRATDGMGFVFKFPISVTQLGVSKKALRIWAKKIAPRVDAPFQERAAFPNLTVEMINAKNGYVELSANFSAVELETIPSDDGFVYLSVDEETYPRDFEGILRLTHPMSMHGGGGGLSCNIIWNHMFGDDGLVYFTTMLTNTTSLPFNQFSCPLVTFTYQVPDLQELRQVMGARDTQNKCQFNKNLNLMPRLVEEMEDFGDVVHVPELSDTPSNLPLAALGFFRHAVDNYDFDYLAVTSDRAFLAIDQLMPRLQNSDEGTWRSSFRRLVAVNRYGDEAETNYHSSHYPVIPAETGSVLSRDLVDFLARNSESFSPFSSVSASLGVWLAPVSPETLDEGEWTSGNSTCTQATVAYGPVWDKNGMMECWKNYRKCNKMCECS
jgi:hypothetical protein